MRNVTAEQTKQARGASLIDYFTRSGYNLKRQGDILYIQEVPSLCIRESDGAWYYHYESVGGNNSVNCLTQVLGKDFITAVEELSSGGIGTVQYVPPPITATHEEKREFTMPERAEHYKNVYANFIKTRAIPREVLTEFIKENLLYQDTHGNAVFVRRDDEGKVVGAEIQGTNSSKRFKKDVGGDSRLFQFPVSCKAGEAKRAYVFESAIDLMSFYAFSKKEKLQGAVLVSMGGLKPEAVKEMENRGVKIYACVDNDEGGRKFCIDNNFHSASGVLAERNVKDWNELLQAVSHGILKPPESRSQKIVENDVTEPCETKRFLNPNEDNVSTKIERDEEISYGQKM
jgi:hypothetical protein